MTDWTSVKKFVSLAASMAIGVTLLGAAPAFAANNPIIVPTDFIPGPAGNGSSVIGSDTRLTGKYEVSGSALHIWTYGSPSFSRENKVAEYVRTTTLVADAAAEDEPSLEFDNTSGGFAPGTQLGVDFDADGETDGILVGEPVYNGDWWLNNAAKPEYQTAAPVIGGGSGSQYHGTLDQWSEKFPNAVIRVFGFSLGSGVIGDGYLRAINLNGVRYTFAAPPPPDTTGPVITCTGPTEFIAGSTGTVTATAEDAGSGPASATLTAAANTSSLGVKTVTFTADDNKGNRSTKDCTYTVVAGPASSVVVVSGTPQSTPVGTQFGQPLQVKVTNAYGFALEGISVTFTAPSTGASGTFGGASSVVVATDATGVAATMVNANLKTGTWTATAAVGGVSGTANFSLTNTAAPAKKADVQVTLSGPTTLKKGQTATYTLTVRNVGPDAAIDVVPSLALPVKGVKIVSASGSNARFGGLVVWSKISTLAKNGTATYTVTVKATCSGRFGLLGAAASLRTGDPALNNNVAAQKLTIS